MIFSSPDLTYLLLFTYYVNTNLLIRNALFFPLIELELFQENKWAGNGNPELKNEIKVNGCVKNKQVSSC